MRPIYVLFIILSYTFSPGHAQVVDSTFGEPYSFDPGLVLPGMTGNDFSEREDQAYSMLFTNDGKIIIAGRTAGENDCDFAFTRLLPNGQYDQEAGPDGKVQLDLGFQHDSCLAAVRYGADKMLMGGSAEKVGAAGFSALLIKTDFDGQLDSSFGAQGKLLLDLPGQHGMITRLHPLPEGKILVAGNIFYLYGLSWPYPDSTIIFIGRLLADGSVDSSFGEDGFIYKRRNNCGATLLGDLKVYPDGAFIITGETYDPYPGDLFTDGNCELQIYVSRYLPDGAIDLDFGEAGTVNVPFTLGWAMALGLAEDGKIIVAGLTSDGLTLPIYTTIVRLLPDGTPDSTFANNGSFSEFIIEVVTDPADPVGLVIRGDKIFVGFSSTENTGHFSIGVLCLTDEGQLNNDFGGNGVFTYHSIYPWTKYLIKDLQLSSDHQSLYFVGSFKRLIQFDNMFITKLNINDNMVAVETDAYINQKIQLFPNPLKAGDLLYVNLPDAGTASDLLFRVYDSRGKRVMNQKTDADTLHRGLDIPGLSSGIYFVEISFKGGHLAGKVVVFE